MGAGQTINGRGRLSSSSVTLHGGPACGGQVMTSCGLQSNDSLTAGQSCYVPLRRHLVITEMM